MTFIKPIADSLFKQEKQQLAIMFADVAGSTRLYEHLGDVSAEKQINDCLQLMESIVQRHHGQVVKKIGDEIMVQYNTAIDAANCAISIQNQLSELTDANADQLQVKMGLHVGDAIFKQGDWFGDVINVAARMEGIAQQGQIIVTEDFEQSISEHVEIETRPFDNVKVKGKAIDISVFEIVWNKTDLTMMKTRYEIKKTAVTEPLHLHYNDLKSSVGCDTQGFVIGRGKQCDLIVNTDLASRVHLVIEYHRGKFVIIDKSSNGTYIQGQDGRELYLRREELPLIGKGTIGLGEPVTADNQQLIYFST
ncbi:MAG: adenylate/guanylate cyclase domain-containing protein [Algicola sp.]|nr:adenylate/guanylate cyclase domain-containing protein [Algicola sp.]